MSGSMDTSAATTRASTAPGTLATLVAAQAADRHGNLYTGPNTEDTPAIVEATAFGGPSRTDVQVLFRLERSEGAGLIAATLTAMIGALGHVPPQR